MPRLFHATAAPHSGWAGTRPICSDLLKWLTDNESLGVCPARGIAANIAKLPELSVDFARSQNGKRRFAQTPAPAYFLQSDRSVSPGSWFQLTLPGNPLVIVSKTLYLIFKFAVALWQPFDDDIRSVRSVESALKKQTLTKLEFVLGHNRP
jgi:hypothetical protein